MQKPTTIPNLKFYEFFCMLLTTLLITSDIFAFKIIKIGYLVVPAGSFLMPFWFLVVDVFTELYGYTATKKVIWLVLLCVSIFCVLSHFLLLLPSPNLQLSYDYYVVIGEQSRILIGNISGIILGVFLNSYLLTKWKILLKGKYFYIRTVFSSFIGQFIFSSVTLSIGLGFSMDVKKLLLIIITSYSIKMLVLVIFGWPSSIITFALKKIWGIDNYDHNVKFNPFRT